MQPMQHIISEIERNPTVYEAWDSKGVIVDGYSLSELKQKMADYYRLTGIKLPEPERILMVNDGTELVLKTDLAAFMNEVNDMCGE